MALLSLVASAAIAAVLAFHHLRYVRYHRDRGREAPAGLEWVAFELRDGLVLGWWYLRGFFGDGGRGGHGRPVVCIHGYTQAGANFVGLRAHLRRPSVAISLQHRFAPLRWYAARLEGKLQAYCRAHPDGIDVVAHSMGGVVLRMVLDRRPDLAAVVRVAVTLGTPHRGTAAGRGLGWTPEIRALKRRSALLAQLPALPALVPHGRVVTVASTADTVVYPVETALADGAEPVVLDGVGHAGLLTDRGVFEVVRRALDGEALTTGTAPRRRGPPGGTTPPSGAGTAARPGPADPAPPSPPDPGARTRRS